MLRVFIPVALVTAMTAAHADPMSDQIGDTYLELRENFSARGGAIMVIGPDDTATLFTFEPGVAPTQTPIDVTAGGYDRARAILLEQIASAAPADPKLCNNAGRDLVRVVTAGDPISELTDDCPGGRVTDIITLVHQSLRR